MFALKLSILEDFSSRVQRIQTLEYDTFNTIISFLTALQIYQITKQHHSFNLSLQLFGWMKNNFLFGTIAVILSLSAILYLASSGGPNAQNVQILVNYPHQRLKVQSLYIRGNSCGLNWNKGIIMALKSENNWAIALTCPFSTPIQIKILQNDVNWMMGKNFQLQIYASQSAKTFTVYPSFYPSINSIVDTSPIVSKILNNSRKCSIYYPPSYYDNTFKKYPILLMHDGQNLFEDSKSAFGAWKIQDTLNNLIVSGAIQEIIVVGIWNTNNRNNQYTYSYDPTQKFGGKGDAYLNFIQQELMPNLTKNTFNARIQGDRWSIGGSSLGGLISCYAAHSRPTVYEKAICMSSSFWWNNEDFSNKILYKWVNQTIYIDSGDSGASQDSMNDTLRVRSKYRSLGLIEDYNLFYYLDKGGQHNQKSWGNRFGVPLKKMFP